MKNIKNQYINGFFRAWDMLMEFSNRPISAILQLRESSCKSFHVAVGFIFCGLAAGAFMWLMGSLALWVLGKGAGAAVAAFMSLWFFEWRDRGAGLAEITSIFSRNFAGDNFEDSFNEPESSLKAVKGSLSATVLSGIVLIKLVCYFLIFYYGRGKYIMIFPLVNYYVQGILAATVPPVVLNLKKREKELFCAVAFLVLVLTMAFDFKVVLSVTLVVALFVYLLLNYVVNLVKEFSKQHISMFGALAEFTAIITLLLYMLGTISK